MKLSFNKRQWNWQLGFRLSSDQLALYLWKSEIYLDFLPTCPDWRWVGFLLSRGSLIVCLYWVGGQIYRTKVD